VWARISGTYFFRRLRSLNQGDYRTLLLNTSGFSPLNRQTTHDGQPQLLQDVQRPSSSFRVGSSVRTLPWPLSASLLRLRLGLELIVR
jgi:hypothetical protein